MASYPIRTVLDDYDIVTQVPKPGGMGLVYRARRPAGQLIALKIIPLQPNGEADAIVRSERRGAEVQKLLGDCDSHVPRIYDFGEKHGVFFIEMEYIDGEDLSGILRRFGRVHPREAVRIAHEVAAFLDVAHRTACGADQTPAGLVHADLKPSNIRLERQTREVKILDFGIAKAGWHTATVRQFGSLAYMSPERIEGRIDRHSDYWALGVVLYEMLAGRLPFAVPTGPSHSHDLQQLILSRQPPPPLSPAVPAPLRAVVAKMLDPESKKRYQDAAGLKSDLAALLQGSTPSGVLKDVNRRSTPSDTRQWSKPSSGPVTQSRALPAREYTAAALEYPAPATPLRAISATEREQAPPAPARGYSAPSREPASTVHEHASPASEYVHDTIELTIPLRSPHPSQLAQLAHPSHPSNLSHLLRLLHLPHLPHLSRLRHLPRLLHLPHLPQLSHLSRLCVLLAAVLLIDACAVHRASRNLAADLRSDPQITADAAWARYEGLRRWSFAPLVVRGVQPALRDKLVTAADRVLHDFRRDQPVVRATNWQSARDWLEHAVSIGPRDPAILARLRCTEGHLLRIGAEGERTRARRTLRLQDALKRFEQAARLDDSSPDPYLGLARIYAYGLFDVERTTEALAEAERRGQPIGRRGHAQMADVLLASADRLRQAASGVRDLPEERAHLRSAAAQYEQALAHYDNARGFALVPDNVRTVRARFAQVQQRLAELDTPLVLPIGSVIE